MVAKWFLIDLKLYNHEKNNKIKYDEVIEKFKTQDKKKIIKSLCKITDIKETDKQEYINLIFKMYKAVTIDMLRVEDKLCDSPIDHYTTCEELVTYFNFNNKEIETLKEIFGKDLEDNQLMQKLREFCKKNFLKSLELERFLKEKEHCFSRREAKLFETPNIFKDLIRDGIDVPLTCLFKKIKGFEDNEDNKQKILKCFADGILNIVNIEDIDLDSELKKIDKELLLEVYTKSQNIYDLINDENLKEKLTEEDFRNQIWEKYQNLCELVKEQYGPEKIEELNNDLERHLDGSFSSHSLDNDASYTVMYYIKNMIVNICWIVMSRNIENESLEKQWNKLSKEDKLNIFNSLFKQDLKLQTKKNLEAFSYQESLKNIKAYMKKYISNESKKYSGDNANITPLSNGYEKMLTKILLNDKIYIGSIGNNTSIVYQKLVDEIQELKEEKKQFLISNPKKQTARILEILEAISYIWNETGCTTKQNLIDHVKDISGRLDQNIVKGISKDFLNKQIEDLINNIFDVFQPYIKDDQMSFFIGNLYYLYGNLNNFLNVSILSSRHNK